MPKPHGYTGTRSVFLIIDVPYYSYNEPVTLTHSQPSRARPGTEGRKAPSI